MDAILSANAGNEPAQQATTTQPALTQPEPKANPNADFLSSIQNSELRGMAEVKQWKSVDDVLQSYKNAEGLLGHKADELVVAPNDKDPDSYTNYLKKAGLPDSADEYDIQLKDGDEQMTKAFKDMLHKSGLTKKQATSLVNNYSEWANNLTKQMQDKQTNELLTKQQNDLNALKAEWSINYDENLYKAKQAIKFAGLNENETKALEQALGTKRAVEIMHKFALPLNESKFKEVVNDDYSPEGARERINHFMRDKEKMSRLMKGDKAEQLEWTNLHNLLVLQKK